jgi:hypothetical protein
MKNVKTTTKSKDFVKTEKDYEEFLELLNKHDVRYCIIGAFALAFHCRPFK